MRVGGDGGGGNDGLVPTPFRNPRVFFLSCRRDLRMRGFKGPVRDDGPRTFH